MFFILFSVGPKTRNERRMGRKREREDTFRIKFVLSFMLFETVPGFPQFPSFSISIFA